jgi:hypothetical protein
MDLRVIGWGGMDWIDLAQDRDQWRALVNTVMKHENGVVSLGIKRPESKADHSPPSSSEIKNSRSNKTPYPLPPL